MASSWSIRVAFTVIGFSTLCTHANHPIGSISTSPTLDSSLPSQTPDLAFSTDKEQHTPGITITSMAGIANHRAALQKSRHLQ